MISKYLKKQWLGGIINKMNTALLADTRACPTDPLSILLEMSLLDYVTAATALFRESSHRSISQHKRFQPISMLLLCADHKEKVLLDCLFREASGLDDNLDIQQALLTVQIETINDIQSMLIGLLTTSSPPMSHKPMEEDWDPRCLQTLQSLIWQHAVQNTPGALKTWCDLPYTQTGWAFLQENVFSQRPVSTISPEENHWQENHEGALKVCIEASRQQLSTFLESEFFHSELFHKQEEHILTELKNNNTLLEKFYSQYPFIYHTSRTAEKTPSILEQIHSLPLLTVTIEDTVQAENTDEIGERGYLFPTWESEIEHLINHILLDPSQKTIIAFDLENPYHQRLLNTIESLLANHLPIQYSERFKKTWLHNHTKRDVYSNSFIYLTKYLLLTTPELGVENFNALRIRSLLLQWVESLYLARVDAHSIKPKKIENDSITIAGDLSGDDLQFTLGQWLQKAANEDLTIDIQMVNNTQNYITQLEETLPEALRFFVKQLRNHIVSCQRPSVYFQFLFQFLLEQYDTHFSTHELNNKSEKNKETAFSTEFISHIQRETAACVTRIRKWEQTLAKYYPICFSNQAQPLTLLTLQNLLSSCLSQWSHFWRYLPDTPNSPIILCDYRDLSDLNLNTRASINTQAVTSQAANSSVQIFLPALCKHNKDNLKKITQYFCCHISTHPIEGQLAEERLAEVSQWTPHPHFCFNEDIQPSATSPTELLLDTAYTAIETDQADQSNSIFANPIYAPSEIISISASKIQTYLDCPRKYYYQSVLKLSQTESDASIRGILTHRIMEVFLNHVFANPQEERTSNAPSKHHSTHSWSDESLHFITQRLFDLDSDYFNESDLIKIRSLDPVALRDLKKDLTLSIDSLKAEGFFASQPQNVTTEKKLSHLYQTKDTGPWEFTGRIDALFEYSTPDNTEAAKTVLLDFKTGRTDLTQTKPETRWNHLRYSFNPLTITNTSPQPVYYVQLPLYTWLCRENHIPLTHIGLQFIRPQKEKNSGSVNITLDTSEFCPEEWLESLNQTVLKPIRQSEHFDVKPSTIHCKQCPYNNLCEGPAQLKNQGDTDEDESTKE